MSNKIEESYIHGNIRPLGILLVNLGTPEKPTAKYVRKYLKEFLSDKRVIEIPRIIWWFILNLIILNVRPKRSAKLYQKIWMTEGSPLFIYTEKIKNKLQEKFNQSPIDNVIVEMAMTYGKPSISSALKKFKSRNISKILILPLFPQYSATTSGAVFDQVAYEFQKSRYIPDTKFVSSYHDNKSYIDALKFSIEKYWEKNGKGEKLVFSFHGLPLKNLHHGDPYHCYCIKTGRLIAESLNLHEDDYYISFQSRFGFQEWLKPYTDDLIGKLVESGTKRIDVCCPGFICDCLETLEEINMQSREKFFEAGGVEFNYIDALNDSEESIDAFYEISKTEINSWINNFSEENFLNTKKMFENHQYNK